MVKTARLTWGFSLCKLRVPVILLETGLGKQPFSTSPVAFGRNGSGDVPRRRRRHHLPSAATLKSVSTGRAKLEEDVELALLINPPQLASTTGDRTMHAGAADPRTRFFVYLVSLALSLAALSILKLHKLLEWLLLDADVSVVQSRVQELRTKSALISEILRAAALRYIRSSNPPPLPTTPTVPSSPAHLAAPFEPSVLPQGTTNQSTPGGCRKTTEPPSRTATLCFHNRSVSERCLLCRLTAPSWQLHSVARQRSQSESMLGVAWATPSRLDAGICRAQVGGCAGALSVETCPSLSPAARGLQLASAVRKGGSRIFGVPPVARASPIFSLSPTTSANSTPNLFRRTSKLVACVAPTPTKAPPPPSPPTTSVKQTIESLACRNSFPAPLSLLYTVQEEVEEEEDEPLVALPVPDKLYSLAITSCGATPLQRATCDVCPSVVRRNRSIGVCPETRDVASSPLPPLESDSSVSEDLPEADGLELDDDGFFFATDYIDRRIVFPEDEEVVGGEENEDDLFDEKLFPEPQRPKSLVEHGEELAGLVVLTSSISDELLQLESGCQQLISRVSANRIELERFNDRLSFVWDSKDDRTTSAISSSSSSSTSMMDESFISSSARYPGSMGRSFISSSGCCCSCQCGAAARDETLMLMSRYDPKFDDDDDDGLELGGAVMSPMAAGLLGGNDLTMMSSLTLMEADSPSQNNFFHPSISFEDEDAVGWCLARPLGAATPPLNSSKHHLTLTDDGRVSPCLPSPSTHTAVADSTSHLD